MSNGDREERVELDLANKKAIFHGANIVNVISMVGIAGMLVFMFLHYEDSKAGRYEFITAMKEQATATREATGVAKEQNCLLTVKPEERQQWADWCKKNSR